MPKTFLAKLSDLEEGRGKNVRAAGKEVLVCLIDGRPRAYRNFCPHMGGSLRCVGRELVCGMHGARYDVEGVKPPTPPASSMSRIEEFPVLVEGDDLYADLVEEKNMWEVGF